MFNTSSYAAGLMAALLAAPASASSYINLPFSEYVEGVDVRADPLSTATPLGYLWTYVTQVGLGCIDSRYCGLGEIEIRPQGSELVFQQSGTAAYSFSGTVKSISYAPQKISLHVRLSTPYLSLLDAGGGTFYRTAFSGLDVVLGNLTGYASDPDAVLPGQPDTGLAGDSYLSLVGTVPVPAAGGMLALSLAALLAAASRRSSSRPAAEPAPAV